MRRFVKLLTHSKKQNCPPIFCESCPFFHFDREFQEKDIVCFARNPSRIRCKTVKYKNFKTFNDNRLFIFSTIRINKDILKEELEYLIKKSNKNDKKYNIIYVLSLNKLCIFDLKNNNYAYKELDKEIIYKIEENVNKFVGEN